MHISFSSSLSLPSSSSSSTCAAAAAAGAAGFGSLASDLAERVQQVAVGGR